MVRRRGPRSFPPPMIVGIDDWAWRRNHRYGTLICDLERRATIALLPDREPATAEVWLAQQSQICVVARDRGGGYGAAAQWALPHAIQVADRWHLMANASSSRAPPARTVARLLTVGPERLSKAETITVTAIESGSPFWWKRERSSWSSRASFAERRSRSLTSGSAKPDSASSPRSPTAYPKTKRRSRRRSPCHGPTGNPKVRSASLSSSNARCTAAETSTYSKLASWASRRRPLHRKCVRANFPRLNHTLRRARPRSSSSSPIILARFLILSREDRVGRRAKS